jgi:IS5 family transposase
MIKILVLQSLYNISDDKAEFLIRDRFSSYRVLGLMAEIRVPDAEMIRLFREQLTKKGIVKELFHGFKYQLQAKVLGARKGEIVDASFIEASKQRSTRDENKDVKAGITSESFDSNPHKASQKDLDARCTKENEEFPLVPRCMLQPITKVN